MPPPSPSTAGSSPASPAPSDLGEVLAEMQRIATAELELTRPLHPTDELVRDLELDSMGLIVLAVGLENRFRVKLSEEDAAQLVTVEDLAALVLRRVAEAGGR